MVFLNRLVWMLEGEGVPPSPAVVVKLGRGAAWQTLQEGPVESLRKREGAAHSQKSSEVSAHTILLLQLIHTQEIY